MATHSHPSQASEILLASYLEFERLGLKVKAKEAIQAILDSVPTLADKDAWTRAYLERLPKNGASRVRHEIYRDVVFPALWARFENDDAEASYLLGKTCDNFISDTSLSKRVGSHAPIDFFERAYMSDPSSKRFRLGFLTELFRGFVYLFHEWPTGILVDHANWAAELQDLKAEIELARVLDEENMYIANLNEFTEMVKSYIDRLSDRDFGQ